MEISNGILLLLQAILGIMAGVLAVLAWIGKQILIEVRRTNGRLTTVETAIKEHNLLDEQRFGAIEKRLDREER